MKKNALLIILISIFFLSCNKPSKLEPSKWETPKDGKFCFYGPDNKLVTSCDLIQFIKKDCAYIFGISKKQKYTYLDTYEGALSNGACVRIFRNVDSYFLRCMYQYQHQFVDVYIYVEKESLDFHISTNAHVRYDSKENKVIYEHRYYKENGDYVNEKFFDDEAVEMLNKQISQWIFMMNLLCEDFPIEPEE